MLLLAGGKAMHIYLNPPRTFWAIAGTDIRLTRSQAFYEVTDDEFNSLDEEQKEILRLAKETNVITEINKEFIPKNQGMAGVDYIITLPATEIQKKYVSKMRMAKDVKSLNALLQKEKESSSPRSSVIQMIKFALDSLAFDTGGDY